MWTPSIEQARRYLQLRSAAAETISADAARLIAVLILDAEARQPIDPAELIGRALQVLLELGEAEGITVDRDHTDSSPGSLAASLRAVYRHVLGLQKRAALRAALRDSDHEWKDVTAAFAQRLWKGFGSTPKWKDYHDLLQRLAPACFSDSPKGLRTAASRGDDQLAAVAKRSLRKHFEHDTQDRLMLGWLPMRAWDNPVAIWLLTADLLEKVAG